MEGEILNENQNQNNEIQNPAQSRTSSKEIGLNKPTPFDGDRKKIRKFIQECNIYMAVNHEIYRDDQTKIAFVLSYMNEKEAARWKETYINHITNDEMNEIKFPMLKVFYEELFWDFRSADRV